MKNKTLCTTISISETDYKALCNKAKKTDSSISNTIRRLIIEAKNLNTKMKIEKEVRDIRVKFNWNYNSNCESKLKELLPNVAEMAFNQNPEDKLKFVENLQNQNKKVAMLGDGLNDAGALKQSNIGIAIADDNNSFTPASDVIMNGEQMKYLPDFLNLSKNAMTIVKITFGVSLTYNVVGLAFAVTGHLSPLIAAILMPISSISVVAFTSLSTWLRSRKYFKF